MTVPAADDRVLAEIEEHVQGQLEREVGGVLVGRIDAGHTTITAALPALEAIGERANVTFTHEVWEEVLGAVDRDHPGERIVGWYHSHPGFGIFLSSYDTFIHENFFSEAGMVALVVDPHDGTRGWFGWREGGIVRLEGGSAEGVASAAATGARRAAESGGGRQRGPVGNTVVVAAGIAVLAFAGGWWWGTTAQSGTSSVGSPEVVEETTSNPEELATAEAEIEELERELLQAQRDDEQSGGEEGDLPSDEDPENSVGDDGQSSEVPSSVAYRVRPGDTLWDVAVSLLGDGHRWREILDNNQGVSPAALEVGSELRVPVREGREVE